MILALARLVDTDARTLSFHMAVRELALPKTDPRLEEIKQSLNAFSKQCGILREHRHNRIAHRYAEVALAKTTLSKLTIKMIGDVIEGTEKLHDSISLVHNESSTSWNMQSFAGVDTLLKVLGAGNDALDVERNRKEISDES